jgi:hypothetical protein
MNELYRGIKRRNRCIEPVIPIHMKVIKLNALLLCFVSLLDRIAHLIQDTFHGVANQKEVLVFHLENLHGDLRSERIEHTDSNSCPCENPMGYRRLLDFGYQLVIVNLENNGRMP